METISLLISLLTALIAITVFPGILIGIIFAVKASEDTDLVKKKKSKKWMWFGFLGPIVLLVVLLTLWGLLNLIIATFTK